MRSKLARPINDFAGSMFDQLVKNEDKGGWYGSTAKYLFRKMYRCMDLARLGIENQASVEYVTKKLADAANYAMMLADNYDREHDADGNSKNKEVVRSECDHSTYLDLEDGNNEGENDCDA